MIQLRKKGPPLEIERSEREGREEQADRERERRAGEGETDRKCMRYRDPITCTRGAAAAAYR